MTGACIKGTRGATTPTTTKSCSAGEQCGNQCCVAPTICTTFGCACAPPFDTACPVSCSSTALAHELLGHQEHSRCPRSDCLLIRAMVLQDATGKLVCVDVATDPLNCGWCGLLGGNICGAGARAQAPRPSQLVIAHDVQRQHTLLT